MSDGTTSDALREIASNGCLHIDEAAGLTRPCTSARTLSDHWCPNCLLEVAADRIDELQAKYDALVEAARRLADLTRDHQLLCHRALCLPDADCEQPRYSNRVKNVAAKVAAQLPEEQEAR